MPISISVWTPIAIDGWILTGSSLPGADRLALKTGATVIANAEAINCLRRAGVPEEQLILVAGGERIPLFTKDILAKAKAGTIDLALGPVLAPPTPHVKYAALAVHAWPSLHCLLPDADDIPDVFDTGKHYPDNDDGFMSSLAVTKIMQNVVFRMRELVPENELDAPSRSISDYVSDRRRNIMSHYDGGQIIYNFLIGDKVVLFNSHTGAYDGVMRSLQPKPDVAFLAAAGRPNLNGRPWVGSAAEFLTEEVKWLGEPKQVYFCLHDER